jgi:hypothetical protein
LPEETVTVGNLPPLAVKVESQELTSPGGHRAGLIRFNVWMTAIDGPVAAAVDRFRQMDALVIDLRGNPGGLAVMMSGISGHLLTDSEALIGRMRTRQGTLVFHPNPRLSTPDGRLALWGPGGPARGRADGQHLGVLAGGLRDSAERGCSVVDHGAGAAGLRNGCRTVTY